MTASKPSRVRARAHRPSIRKPEFQPSSATALLLRNEVSAGDALTRSERGELSPRGEHGALVRKFRRAPQDECRAGNRSPCLKVRPVVKSVFCPACPIIGAARCDRRCARKCRLIGDKGAGIKGRQILFLRPVAKRHVEILEPGPLDECLGERRMLGEKEPAEGLRTRRGYGLSGASADTSNAELKSQIPERQRWPPALVLRRQS